jgi:hypothetical protein
MILVLAAAPASAVTWSQPFRLDRLNRKICGRVVDYTHNHDCDRRIWCPSLCCCRDMYVYLPPGYDPSKQYPLVFWFHGLLQDEHSFVDRVAELFDQAIVSGKIGPVIVAAPDGSIDGYACNRNAGCFFINSKAGRFEDYIIDDLWNFMVKNYPIRPEREAHVLAGASMGGFGAFNLGMKYRDRFKIVIGVFPPLNLRWLDCHCRYQADFDPCCWGWRTCIDPEEIVARAFYGLIPVRLKVLTERIVGSGPDAVAKLSEENPIEMLERLDIRPGDLDMYLGYGGRDNYNIDAQVDSFLYVAKQRGLCVEVEFLPDGGHDSRTAQRLFPGILRWLAPMLAPYCPP